MLGEHSVDRLGSPPQPVDCDPVWVFHDEPHKFRCGRSSSTTKKRAAALRILSAHLNSRTPARNSRASINSSVAATAFGFPADSAARARSRIVSADPGSSPPIRRRASTRPRPLFPTPSCDPSSTSVTVRTARLNPNSSSGHLRDLFDDINPPFPRFRVSGNAGILSPTGQLPNASVLKRRRGCALAILEGYCSLIVANAC